MSQFVDPFAELQLDAPRQVTKSEALYTPEESLVRLDRVRRVLQARELDCLLFIAGVDSRDNLGCLQAVNYLLLGACGAELVTPLLLDEDFEDTIIAITKGGIRLYTTPTAGPKVTRIVAAWPCLELVALDRAAFKDQDAFEAHKMEEFKDFMADVGSVGVALSPNAQGAEGRRHMEVEKWPLIQSYALDSEGKRRFFTMAHSVVDVQEDMEQVYRTVGAHEVGVMSQAQGVLLTQHWQGVMQQLQSNARRGVSCLEAVPENLTTYFTYGAMRRAACLDAWGVSAPEMKFGMKTSSPDAHDEAYPLHATLEASDPQAPLSFARTVFLQAEHCSVEVFGTKSVFTNGIIPTSPPAEVEVRNMLRLSSLYAALGQTLQRLRTVCAEEKDFGRRGEADQNCVQDIFGKTCIECGVDLTALGVEDGVSALSVTLRPCDNAPYVSEQLPTSPPECTSLLYIRLHLRDIKGTEGSLLGGLLYGETVGRTEGHTLLLTEAIPWLNVARINGKGVQAEANVRRVLDRVVQKASLPPGDASHDAALKLFAEESFLPKALLCYMEPALGAHVYLPMKGAGGSTEVAGMQYCFADGVVFSDTAAGHLPPLLFRHHDVHIVVHNPLELDTPVTVVFTYGAAWTAWTPLAAAQRAAHAVDPEGSPDHCIVLLLKPGTQAKKEFVMKVLPAWRRAHEVEVVEVLDVKYTVHAKHAAYAEPKPQRKASHGLQVFEDVKDYKPFKKTDTSVKETKLQCLEKETVLATRALLAQFPSFPVFATTHHVASVAKHSVTMPRGLDAPTTAKPVTLMVDVVVGWFGVGKHKFVQHLHNVLSTMRASRRQAGEEDVECHVVANSIQDGVTFDPMLLYKQIREVAELPGQHRIIYTPPGCTPLPTLMHHLGQLSRKFPCLAVNSCTALLNGDYIYANNLSAPHHFQLLQGLTEQLTPGYLSQVLVTGAQTVGLTVNQIETFVKSLNNVCDVVFTTNDAVEGMLL